MHTDIILSGRNAPFLQHVNSSLQAAKARLNSVMSDVYKQQPNLLHLLSVFNTAHHHSMFDSKAMQQSHYIIRIPSQRQKDTKMSIRSGSDALSTAMRSIYYGSTDLLS